MLKQTPRLVITLTVFKDSQFLEGTLKALDTATKSIVKAIMKIHKLLSHDPHSYERMCRGARNAATKYDVERVFPRIEKMFLEVAASRNH